MSPGVLWTRRSNLGGGHHGGVRHVLAGFAGVARVARSAGSFGRLLREVRAEVEVRGQVEHERAQGGVREQLGLGQRGRGARPLLAPAEAAVEPQHHVAEHVAHQHQPQEVVSEELHVRQVCKIRYFKKLIFVGFTTEISQNRSL